ncbi:WG repeat-containing protein [Flavobacterium sp. NG2]
MKNKNEDERYGYIDKNGLEVIPRIYEFVSDFNIVKVKLQIANST